MKAQTNPIRKKKLSPLLVSVIAFLALSFLGIAGFLISLKVADSTIDHSEKHLLTSLDCDELTGWNKLSFGPDAIACKWDLRRKDNRDHVILSVLAPSPTDFDYTISGYVIVTEDGTKNSPAVWMIANLDSGADFSETEFSLFREDDFIRPEQTEWFLRQHALAGEDVPAIAYYHIPQDENGKAWRAVTEDGAALKNKYFKLEGFDDNGSEACASDFIDRAKDHGLVAAFMGHAHNVDWTVEYEGVVIGLGVKTGKELYFAHIDADSDDPAMRAGLDSVGITEDFDLIGASLVTLTGRNGEFDLEHLYFNERADGDFAAWVKW